MKLFDEIVEMIAQVSETPDCAKLLKQNEQLSVAAVNSISFINLVLLIEDKYEIEFDDEHLDFKDFDTVTSLCEYVKKMQQEM
ncbi:phosphopantetheine-binding protein [[Clostridium] polysaccharolyticum]|uniref:Phosphopantetheine attachment site n=1 Tax=[Clostridium] polysaccharolyticum TaxID=29364 RepID=A0A1I0BDY8_9FIRM|nr:phosphopantetheine-binding protein [[Clostridium] polysaccharolyticum]SET05122.1 Phosphopantetheine attachment site [[Clostridium] polysaccharolyticum]